MLSSNLATLLRPYRLLANKHALSPIYRCLQFTPGKILGCSASTVLETKCDHGLAETICVDATAFLTILSSLPEAKEVTFSVTDGVLHWVCGPAKGRLASLAVDDMPTITRRAIRGAHKPSAAFAKALQLGAISCDSNSLLSVGMYGIVIDNRGPLIIHSSDNVTVSVCTVGDVKLPAPDIMTLAPGPAELLAMLIMPDDSTIEFTDDTIFYVDKYCKAILKCVPPLKYDALSTVKEYAQADTTALIPPDLIGGFIKRATALAENKRHTYIALQASNGKLSLEFSEGLSSADEFYLVEDLIVPDLDPIDLDASKLTRAMQHITEIVLDHVERGVIILQGKSPDFKYLIAGRAK